MYQCFGESVGITGRCQDERTVWKWNTEREEVIYEIDDAVYHPDSLDALRYAYTQYLINEHLISQ